MRVTISKASGIVVVLLGVQLGLLNAARWQPVERWQMRNAPQRTVVGDCWDDHGITAGRMGELEVIMISPIMVVDVGIIFSYHDDPISRLWD